MRLILLSIPLITWVTIGAGCNDQKNVPALHNAHILPAEATKPHVSISNLNYWSEQGQFFVTGICNNADNTWQKIWLQVEFFDKFGNPVQLKSHNATVIPTFSEAVPPKGQTAFFAGWPLTDFSGAPDATRITTAGAIQVPAGPILLVEQISGVKIMASKSPQESTQEEVAWQVSAVLNNPMPTTAEHPRLEMLLYGTDNRLWFSTLLNPEDPQIKQMFSLEKEGPMMAAEKRNLGVYVYYDRLPAALKQHKIGRVEMLAFEQR